MNHGALLRPRRERPRRRAAEQRDELTSSYVGHGLPVGSRCVSLLHAQDARKCLRRSAVHVLNCRLPAVSVALLFVSAIDGMVAGGRSLGSSVMTGIKVGRIRHVPEPPPWLAAVEPAELSARQPHEDEGAQSSVAT